MSMLVLVGLKLELRSEGTKVLVGEGRVGEMLGNIMLGGVVLLSITLGKRIWLKG